MYVLTSGASRIFLRGGVLTPKVGVLTYYFAIFLAENCMKMKEFGPKGGRVPGGPLGSPNAYCSNWKLLSGENIAMATKMLKKKLASMVFAVVVTSPKYFPSLFHMTEMTTTVKLAKAVMTRQDL